MREIWICNRIYRCQLPAIAALSILLISAGSMALASELPPHLAGFAAQLLRANKDKLKSPSGTPERQILLERAYKAFKKRSMQHWSPQTLTRPDLLNLYTEALGGLEVADLANLHNDWNEVGLDAALAAYYDARGGKAPSRENLELLKEKLQTIRAGVAGELATAYVIELENGDRVALNWTPKTGDFQVSAYNIDHDDEPPYEVTLHGKTNIEMREEDAGAGALMHVIPSVNSPIEALDAKAMVARAKQLDGTWYDNEGRVWQISANGTADGTLQLSFQRVESHNQILFPDARLSRGSVTASRLYTDVSDLDTGLPDQIKSQMIGNERAREKLLLHVNHSVAGEEILLEGYFERLQVTYNPSSFEISDIHSPYTVPVTLQRTAFEMGM